MDFTLSLAHFCELHGPTSVLCTQVLPPSCLTCRPPHQSSRPASSDVSPERSKAANNTYPAPPSKSWRAAAGQQDSAGFTARDIDRCASCRMTIPDATYYDPSPFVDKNRPPIRTKESIHICGQDSDESYSFEDDAQDLYPSPSSEIFPTSSQSEPFPMSNSAHSSSSCHTHTLEYVTAPSPASTAQYAALRTAVIRALSGEVLPRGQISGPLWFGNSSAGYVIAYQFELKDARARGRRRQYALIALAGHEMSRALSAATLLWSCFEQIANNIIIAAQTASRARRRANNLALSKTDESGTGAVFVDKDDDSEQEREREEELQMQEMMRRPGVNSFLTGRGALGRMTGASALLSDRRGGVANAADLKATSIAELVDNEKFYCELHLVFVGILQQLGRDFGGMQVRSPKIGESLLTSAENKANQKLVESHGANQTDAGSRGATYSIQDGWTTTQTEFHSTTRSTDNLILSAPGVLPNPNRQVAV